MDLNMDLSLSSLIFTAFFESIGYILPPNKGSFGPSSLEKIFSAAFFLFSF